MAATSDKIVVVVYLLGSLALGIAASRWFRGKGAPGQDSEDDYFLAGRRVPGWMNGISYAATALNADVGPTYCGLAVVVGLPIAFFYLPRFALAWMIAALVFAVRWRQLGIRTGPEFYALRFGGQRTRIVRIYSSLFAVFVNMAPWIGAGLLGVHKIFGPAFGITDKATTLSIVLPVLLIYVWIGGFAGVVVTDIMQTAVIVLASVILCVAVLWEHGGPSSLATAIQAAHPDNAADILSTWPVPDHRVLGPLVVLAWLIVPTVGRGGSVDLEGQRLFSCKSDRDAALMNVWAVIGLFVMLALLTLPAMGLLVKHPDLYLAEPAEREKAYSLLLDEYLPSGLYGVALAALLASVMSTISSHLSYGSQTLVNDVVRQLIPDAKMIAPGSKGSVWVGRLLMLVILGLGIAVTYQADSLIGIAIVLAGMYGATATVYWGQWWWWRVNFWSWLTAMVGGPIIYVMLGGLTIGSWRIPGLLEYVPGWTAARGASESAAQGMDMMQAAIGMAITCMAWVLVTLLTKPEPMETLTEFYLRARPMGYWAPVRKQCLAEAAAGQIPRPGLLVDGLLIAVVGAVAVSSGVLAASVGFVGRWIEAAAFLTVAAALGYWFVHLFNRRMHRLGADDHGDDTAGSST
ncbi:sodium:solute symporter family transporter [Aeoliella sp. SH292]|uniref:sodium:solute symporter family transporter n=1 Tax=Aeoliella sp. SH292 TaxID=3454464 RepID=UPI003F957686